MGNLIGSLVGSILGKQGQESANKNNLQIMREQNAFNKHMWEMNNAYNTPLMQRLRLQEAGLNPYTMMDGGSAGNSGSAAAGAAPASMENPMAGFSALGSAPSISDQFNQGAEFVKRLKDISVQDDKNNAEIEKAKSEAESNRERAALDSALRITEDSTRLGKVNVLDAQRNLFDAQSRKTVAEAITSELGLKWYDKTKQAELNQMIANTDLIRARKQIALAQTDSERAKAAFAFRMEAAKLGNLLSQSARNDAERHQIEQLLPAMGRRLSAEAASAEFKSNRDRKYMFTPQNDFEAFQAYGLSGKDWFKSNRDLQNNVLRGEVAERYGKAGLYTLGGLVPTILGGKTKLLKYGGKMLKFLK